MTKDDSQIPPHVREFIEFWTHACSEKHTAQGDEGNDCRQELASFWGEYAESMSEDVKRFYDNLLNAAGFFQQFSDGKSDFTNAEFADSDEGRLFYNIPVRLFEQHMKMAGVSAEDWSEWFESLKEEPVKLKNYVEEAGQLQTSVSQYMQGFVSMMNRATERFSEQENEGDTKVAFDHWVRCFETEYDEYVRGEEYPKQYADVLNGSARLGQLARELMRPWQQMPGIRDNDESAQLMKQVEELRKENKKLRAKIDQLQANAGDTTKGD